MTDHDVGYMRADQATLLQTLNKLQWLYNNLGVCLTDAEIEAFSDSINSLEQLFVLRPTEPELYGVAYGFEDPEVCHEEALIEDAKRLLPCSCGAGTSGIDAGCVTVCINDIEETFVTVQCFECGRRSVGYKRDSVGYAAAASNWNDEIRRGYFARR